MMDTLPSESNKSFWILKTWKYKCNEWQQWKDAWKGLGEMQLHEEDLFTIED